MLHLFRLSVYTALVKMKTISRAGIVRRTPCMLVLLTLVASIADLGMALPLVRNDFSRYDIILSRMPFGEPPPAPVVVTPKPTGLAPNSPARNLRMCGMTDGPDGLVTYVVNIKPGKDDPVSYYSVAMGEPDNGLDLLDADYESGTARFSFNGEEFDLPMDGGAPGVAAAVPPTAAVKTASSKTATKRPSFRDRLKKKRREEEIARRLREQEANKMTKEQLNKHLQDYQMDVIRQGLPPLPMPLTREMDDKLVAEGVLPPLEEAQ